MANKHTFVQETEDTIRSHEQLWDSLLTASNEWTMWLELHRNQNTHPLVELELIHAQDKRLFTMRAAVEKAYGIVDPSMTQMLIDNCTRKEKKLQAKWFLAKHNGSVVGGVGFIPFQFENKKVARLQSVDIIPKEQGKGFGRALLQNITHHLKNEGYSSVCLMASSENWVKHWYQRFGFEKLGETRP